MLKLLVMANERRIVSFLSRREQVVFATRQCSPQSISFHETVPYIQIKSKPTIMRNISKTNYGVTLDNVTHVSTHTRGHSCSLVSGYRYCHRLHCTSGIRLCKKINKRYGWNITHCFPN